MCKHVAAVLYAIGARLDERSDLLFTLRRVEAQDLIARAGDGLTLSRKGAAAGRVLRDEGLSELFGIEMAEAPRGNGARPPVSRATRRRLQPCARWRSKASSRGLASQGGPRAGDSRFGSTLRDPTALLADPADRARIHVPRS
jgi:hypothetical protein